MSAILVCGIALFIVLWVVLFNACEAFQVAGGGEGMPLLLYPALSLFGALTLTIVVVRLSLWLLRRK